MEIECGKCHEKAIEKEVTEMCLTKEAERIVNSYGLSTYNNCLDLCNKCFKEVFMKGGNKL